MPPAGWLAPRREGPRSAARACSHPRGVASRRKRATEPPPLVVPLKAALCADTRPVRARPCGAARSQTACGVSVTKTSKERRERRAKGVRAKMHGTAEQPRLSVYRSNTHMYAQIIDDDSQKTVCAYNTRMKDFEAGNTWGMEAAEVVGKKIAEKALAAGVEKVCFDRSGFKYHGRIASVADGAREAGLKL